ncbi:MAG: peptidoglycan editing factor PgeF [Candidatus Dormibacteria bacterium]
MGLTGASDPEAVGLRREEMAREIGFDLGRALFTVQEHGAFVRAFHRASPEGSQCVLGTDALSTDVPGQALITYHADCFPVFFLDRSRGVVAGAHVGWRGTLAGVVTQTVQAMHLAYGSAPEDLDVLVGPGICPRCYPVGREVAEQIIKRYGREQRYVVTAGVETHLDIGGAIRLQLEDAGVAASAIESTGWCTREDERWFSHRGGRSGRFMAAIVAP